MKILLVEDDETIVQMLQPTLASQRYLVELASDGQAGWELVDSFEYDLILLDVMLPKLDGINFCKKLRAKGDRTPVLLLTAQDSSTDKVRGLDAGADDYALKPFDIEELLARIRALLRRSSATPSPVLEWGFLRLDPSSCEVTYEGKLLHLTAKEYGILELLLRNTHRIFSQSALLDRVWTFDEPPTENTVRAHIKSLRQKIKKAGAPDLIETVYGLGYRLKAEERESGVVGAGSPDISADKLTIQSNPPVPEAEEQEDKGSGRQGDREDKEELAKYQLPITQSQIPAELLPLWERHREKYINRIAVIEQAIACAQQECLDLQLQQQAANEAHTLIGSLGSFDLMSAAQICRQLERELLDEAYLTQERVQQLSALVTALRQNLNAVEAEDLKVKSRRSGFFEHTCAIANNSTVKPARTEVKTQIAPSTTNYQLPTAKLLILDSDPQLTQVAIAATEAGMEVAVARDLSQAQSAIACNRPDAVLLDLYFCQDRTHGLQFLSTLANAQPPIPTVVVTAPQSFADRVEAARLGARSFLQKPVALAQAIAAIAQVLESTTTEAKLMLVDDDPQLLERLQVLLEPWGFRLSLLCDPQQFWHCLEEFCPDLLILDIEMPQLSGIDLCQVVRNDPQWSELPIIFLSARTDAETIHRVFTIGADDYVNKPVVGPELVARVLNRLERSKIRH